MNLDLTSEEEQLIGSLDYLFAHESSHERIRSAEETGFDPVLWERLKTMGIPSMSLGSPGIDGANLFQLSLVAERAGRALASAPVIETLVAARLSPRCGDPAMDLLDRSSGLSEIATLSLRKPVGGTARLVPAGSIAQIVIALDGNELVGVTSSPPNVPIPNLGSLPLAHRNLATGTRTILATDAAATSAFAAACVDWKVLSASQLVGVASAALDLAVNYVKTREVFGAPLGTFQTIAHRLADDATSIDGARLLTHEAAWAVDEWRIRAEELASMAWCFASETAVNATQDSVHYHGGYGVTVEYDIQLYFRRAKAYSLLWGDPRREYVRLADSLFPVMKEMTDGF